MVARGFKYYTHWKEIKSRVEDVMGVSEVAYGQVKVIGERSPSAIYKSSDYGKETGFKLWLGRYVDEEKKRGIWFKDNIDWEVRVREGAVEKDKLALMQAREARNVRLSRL